MAVVDERLNVHGIQGLRVADCSTVPEIKFGNTNAPAIMIGEKLSDMVLETTIYRPHFSGCITARYTRSRTHRSDPGWHQLKQPAWRRKNRAANCGMPYLNKCSPNSSAPCCLSPLWSDRASWRKATTMSPGIAWKHHRYRCDLGGVDHDLGSNQWGTFQPRG